MQHSYMKLKKNSQKEEYFQNKTKTKKERKIRKHTLVSLNIFHVPHINSIAIDY